MKKKEMLKKAPYLLSGFYHEFIDNIDELLDLFDEIFEDDDILISYLPKEIKESKEFILKALEYNESAISKLIPKKLLKLSEINNMIEKLNAEITSEERLLHALKKSPNNQRAIYLKASDELRLDKSLTKKILEQYPQLFKYIDDKLKDDRDILYSITNYKHFSILVNEKWLTDKDLMLLVVKSHPSFYADLDKTLQKDKDIVKVIMSSYMNSEYISKIPKQYLNEKEIMLHASDKDSIYKQLSPQLQEDIDVIKIALSREYFDMKVLSKK